MKKLFLTLSLIIINNIVLAALPITGQIMYPDKIICTGSESSPTCTTLPAGWQYDSHTKPVLGTYALTDHSRLYIFVQNGSGTPTLPGMVFIYYDGVAGEAYSNLLLVRTPPYTADPFITHDNNPYFMGDMHQDVAIICIGNPNTFCKNWAWSDLQPIRG